VVNNLSKIVFDKLESRFLLGFLLENAWALSKSVLACQKYFLTSRGEKQLVKNLSKSVFDKQKSPFLLGFLAKMAGWRSISALGWSIISPPRSGGAYY
jgi:hypothetical protein